jgi:hypothetical protein
MESLIAPKPAPSPEKSKPEAGKESPGKPAPSPAPEKEEKDPVKLRIAHKKLKEEYETFKQSQATERQSLASKLAELEKKPFLTPEQQARYDALEKRQQDLEAELYARDFQESPEFKTKYQEKWNKQWKDAVEDVKGMQVKYSEQIQRDGELISEEKTRAATQRDFERVFALRNSRAEQRTLAKQLFGEDAAAVLEYTQKLYSIEESGQQEISEKRNTYDQKRRQFQEKEQGFAKTFDATHSEFEQLLVQKYPQNFGDDPENPEAVDAMNKALTMLDGFAQERAKLSPEERGKLAAKQAALIRRYAASFPRALVMLKKKDDIIAAKDAELARYRKTDPGEIEGGGGGGALEKKPMGSDDLAEGFGKTA